ncbi:uncharacterized protein FIBRA_01158 [Fibroporia radiculosa]|uniref:Uncharacterized protein n=1 Tax=Fibroporia radiculosa TaxID=599839 RepID=J4G0U1_9APHY|nr:uncharacterized protein FIBRA_01158 [Fibroporia radiculosa]CCL99143.1 predicted protein [Fibroporia radiculosa]
MRLDVIEQARALLSTSPFNNLRWYISQAYLPPMNLSRNAPSPPPPGHSSHLNLLAVTPESYRSLETIHTFPLGALSEKVIEFVDIYVPAYPLDQNENDDAESVTVPCPPHFTGGAPTVRLPARVKDVYQWVYTYPLQTAQCIVHQMWPDTFDYTFDFENREEIDQEIFFSVSWTDAATPLSTKTPHPSVAVFVQPPWILSPKDFAVFTQSQTFPRVHDSSETPLFRYDCKQRLWAKVWDECFRRKSPWFVITTYWGWVFGAFSRGWTVGFVSEVIPANFKAPTVLESLVFWLGSAMNKPGGWRIPEVPEPVDNINMEVRILIPESHTVMEEIAPSESDWDARSNARFSVSDNTSDVDEDEAIVYKCLVGDVAETSTPLANAFATTRSRVKVHSRIKTWAQGVYPSYEDGPLRPPSPTLSDCTQSSGSTVLDFSSEERREGQWLASNTTERRDDYDQ